MEATWSAARLRSCREKAGFSRERLGELLGVHVNTVRKWEEGESCPVSRRLGLLASVLGTTVAYLSGEEDVSKHDNAEDIFSSEAKNIQVVAVPEKVKDAHVNFGGYGRALVYERKGERIEIPTTKRGYEIFERLIFSRHADAVTAAG